jgi:hypothetical protein
MKIAAIVALHSFPFWCHSLHDLTHYADRIYLRLDGPARTDEQILHWAGKHAADTVCAQGTWNRWNWREQLLRMLDDVKPDIVLTPDEDECFGTHILKDLGDLFASDRQALMFDYQAPLPTNDGACLFDGKPYPAAPHMKAYKWRPGLSYRDYRGFAQVTDYAERRFQLKAESKIWHYCGWTEQMRERKVWRW